MITDKPKKIIRSKIVNLLKSDEWTIVEDKKELQELYGLKILEELEKIKKTEYKDISEFVDLIQASFHFAKECGFSYEEISLAMIEKTAEKGNFKNIVLTNLNPANPSNKIYFNNFKNKNNNE